MQFLSIFTELGLSTLTIREVSRDKSLANKYIGNTLALKLILSTITITALVLVVTLGHYSPQIAAVIYYITLSFVVGAFTSIFYSIFQAYEKMEYPINWTDHKQYHNVFRYITNNILSKIHNRIWSNLFNCQYNFIDLWIYYLRMEVCFT